MKKVKGVMLRGRVCDSLPESKDFIGWSFYVIQSDVSTRIMMRTFVFYRTGTKNRAHVIESSDNGQSPLYPVAVTF